MDRRAWLLLAAVEARAPARLRGPAVPQSTLPRESDKGLLLLSDLAHSCGPCGRIPGPASAERRSRSGAERPGPGARDGTTGCEEVGPLADVAMRMTLPIDARLRPGGAPTPGGPPRLSPVAGGARRRRGALPP